MHIQYIAILTCKRRARNDDFRFIVSASERTYICLRGDFVSKGYDDEKIICLLLISIKHHLNTVETLSVS